MTERAAVLTVTALNALIKQRLENDPQLANCTVIGEISNFKHHSSGHMYFTLKDETSRIRAIMFSSRNRGLAFLPKDGMRVVCRGAVGVFDRDGQYQLYVQDMQPDGIGALYVAYQQLRDKLAAEGLFDSSRKRPLPAFPRRIGVVTSPTGAVIRDICSTLARRYPLAKVILAPALVQGPEAAPTLVHALQRLASGPEPVDVIIIGRGGGSLEELWPFNEEMVARAVAACPIPVISAVGHETDVTICDFVADVRAATPTAAAELAAPNVLELRQQLAQASVRAAQALQWQRNQARQRLDRLVQAAALTSPYKITDLRRQQVDYLEGQLRRTVGRPFRNAERTLSGLTERLHHVDLLTRLMRVRNLLDVYQQRAAAGLSKRRFTANLQLERALASLEALNPLTVLRRGYSVVYFGDGRRVVGSVSDVRPGERLVIQFSDGRIGARVEEGDGSFGHGVQSRLDI
ncbi:MAG: exodeoxyribonuclease VII large subunit [Alicyclobacillus sp.]|nr:exodeoxyribonuclease VII large subunit [Alicyclobacillus sp.]